MIGHGVACYGAADRYLGCSPRSSASASARRYFETALEVNRRMGAQTWLAHTAYAYGRLLLDTGERDRADAMLSQAAAIAGRCGLAQCSHASRRSAPGRPVAARRALGARSRRAAPRRARPLEP